MTFRPALPGERGIGRPPRDRGEPSSEVCQDTAVDLLDLGIVVLAVFAAVNGYRRGGPPRGAPCATLRAWISGGAMLAARAPLPPCYPPAPCQRGRHLLRLRSPPRA